MTGLDRTFRTANAQIFSNPAPAASPDGMAVAGVVRWADVQSKPSAFTPTAHTHAEAEVLGLTAALAAKASLASPALTGTPTAPTAGGGTNTAQIATTAFVQAAIALLINSAPGLLDTLDEIAAALNDDPNFAATMTTALAGKAPLSHSHTASQISDATTAGRNMLMAADAAAQTALLGAFTSALKGLVPASGGGTSNFLRADGTWAAPAGGGGGSSPLMGWFI